MQGLQLIVGLGNPGARYQNTRHNVGFWLLDAIPDRTNPFRVEKRFSGEISEAEYYSQRCFLLKPSTYMNRSGQSVQAMTHYYKVDVRQMLVVHDDLDLPPGTIRLKRGGGHGGHNGLRDIISATGSPDFMRLRIGIGRPLHKGPVTDYVLAPPGKVECEQIETAMIDALKVIPDIAKGSWQHAVHQLHSSG